jgi:hypothetical protein
MSTISLSLAVNVKQSTSEAASMLASTAASHVSGVHCPTTAHGNAATATKDASHSVQLRRCTIRRSFPFGAF